MVAKHLLDGMILQVTANDFFWVRYKRKRSFVLEDRPQIRRLFIKVGNFNPPKKKMS